MKICKMPKVFLLLEHSQRIEDPQVFEVQKVDFLAYFVDAPIAPHIVVTRRLTCGKQRDGEIIPDVDASRLTQSIYAADKYKSSNSRMIIFAVSEFNRWLTECYNGLIGDSGDEQP